MGGHLLFLTLSVNTFLKEKKKSVKHDSLEELQFGRCGEGPECGRGNEGRSGRWSRWAPDSLEQGACCLGGGQPHRLKARSAVVRVTFQTAPSGGRVVNGVEESEADTQLWDKNRSRAW